MLAVNKEKTETKTKRFCVHANEFINQEVGLVIKTYENDLNPTDVSMGMNRASKVKCFYCLNTSCQNTSNELQYMVLCNGNTGCL
jgi:hypothetical protein